MAPDLIVAQGNEKNDRQTDIWTENWGRLAGLSAGEKFSIPGP